VRNVAGKEVQQLLTAVDGSVVQTLSTVAQAAYLKTKQGDSRSAWRLHTHFDVERGVPTRIDVTSACNSGKAEEKNMLRTRLEADHCYVLDRWYAQFRLFDDIQAIGSSYVCRIRDNSNWKVIDERSLSPEAAAADVISDALVELGTSNHPHHPVRVVQVKTTRNLRRGGRHGGGAAPSTDGLLRIATNLLDVPAELIAEIYRHRWTIELFFRFFKHVLGCRHLLSTAREGVEIQTYCAIIACLLISLTSGCKPTLRTYEMVCLYLQGWADEEELLAHVAKLKPSAS
jgi:hypothetical protein